RTLPITALFPYTTLFRSHYSTLHACGDALNDFEQAISLAPTSVPQGYNLAAELYSLESGVYATCSDSTRRDPRRAREIACSKSLDRKSTRLNSSHRTISY